MKKLSLFVMLTVMLAAANTFAQTYKPTFGTKLVLAGGGTDIVNTLTMQAPALGSAYTLTLPVDDGTANQVLQTNGSGVTTWVTAILSGGSAGGDLTGTYPNPTIATGAGPNIVAALNSSGVASSLNADVLKYNSTLVVATNQLGINLTNANTWTGVQSLPANATQGNNLIASVNTGTAGGINANMIGNGLTDAQVVDALTISGGTINNTPVGATTASTGRFTMITGTTLPATSTSTDLVVSNAGALETRTVASLSLATSSEPYLTVGNTAGLSSERGIAVNSSLTGTDGGANASYTLGINLANANTWTATQTLPATAAQGDALITSVNAGTTNISDARVADALTISGGTVNSTPVGATTPSTGAFTTLSASGTTTLSSFATAGVVHNAAGGVLSSSLIVNADVDAAAAIAYSKLVNTSAGSVLLGRGAGAGGAVQEVTLGSNLSMTGTVLNTTGVAASSEPYLTVGNTAGLSAERGIAVNSTLTGTDGGANASYTLGINLANANTWTATQTLPATAAQGDALIASVNAGTTGTVNANMIGIGLTDAQVNNNLTISGGTIDATPIGATTASTAIFTTAETGTLKVTGGTPASGKVLTSDATGNATWQNSGATFTYGVSSPASFGTNQDPLAIADGSSLYRLTSSAAVEIRGLTAGTAGRTVVLINVGSNAITLTHSNATTAANGFHLPTGSIILGPDGSVTCTYDGVTARWRVTANY